MPAWFLICSVVTVELQVLSFINHPTHHTYMHVCTVSLQYSKESQTKNHCKLLCLHCCSAARLPRGCSNWLVESFPSQRYSFFTFSVWCLPEGPSYHTKIVAPLSNLTSKHNCATLMNIVILSKTTNLLILSQMSTSLSQWILNAHVRIESILLIWMKMKSKPKAFKAKCLWYKNWNIILVAELLPQVCRESQAKISSDDNKKTFDLIPLAH